MCLHGRRDGNHPDFAGSDRNGTWHRVVCSRSGRIHKLLVDGALKDQSTNAFSGKFTSPVPVKVGGRAVGKAGHNDQFHGDLDNVFLQIKSRG